MYRIFCSLLKVCRSCKAIKLLLFPYIAGFAVSQSLTKAAPVSLCALPSNTFKIYRNFPNISKINAENVTVNRSRPLPCKIWLLTMHAHLHIVICQGFVTNNNDFWIGRLNLLALLLQLHSIIRAHKQWLSKARSIPYWITSVFCVTDLVPTDESVSCPLVNTPQLNTQLLTNESRLIVNPEWRITSDWILLDWTNFQANRI
jgi:hypothetical protein